MDEDEAEVALLVLGQQIEWVECRDLWLGRVTTGNHYQIMITGLFCNFWDGTDWRSFGENGELATSLGTLKRFSSDAAAKAACERHYATGKWK